MKITEKILFSDSDLGYLSIETIKPTEKLDLIENPLDLFIEKYFPHSYFENEKFYKKVSLDKLNSSFFIKLNSEEFYIQISKQIVFETQNLAVEICKNKLYNELNFKSDFYYLENIEKINSKFFIDSPIWDYFYLYLNIDFKENTYRLIEFGYD